MQEVSLSLFLLVFVTMQSGTQTEEKLFKGLNEKLIALLRPLSDITLHLRTSEDVSNRFIQKILNQTVCPVRVQVVGNNVSTPKDCNKNNAMITDMRELQNAVGRYSSRFGTQFYIIESKFESNAVIEIARSVWERVGILKNYYITSNTMYFYNPFALSASGKYGQLQNTTDCKDFENIFMNLNGYPVRTYIFRSVYANLAYNRKNNKIAKAEGADAEVAYSIEKIMNCKLILAEPDEAFFGHHLENGSYDGAIGRSIRYETDLVLTGFFIKDYFTRDMEFSVTVYTDKLCCYVSKAKRIPQSILPLFSVKIDMWVGFVGSAFFWAAIWAAIRKINLWVNRKKGRPIPKQLTKEDYQYWRIFSDTWVIWVRANICKYPPFSSEKVFVISLGLVGVIFGAIFESSLATVYINPLYYNDINTLEELDESQLKIYIKHAAIKDDLFFGSSSTMFQRLDNKLVYVTNIEERMIDLMSRKGGFASVTRASSLVLDDISYILSKKIHQIPECPKKYNIAYAYPKESPFKERVNDLLLRFLNAGLINHWIEIMYHEAKIRILKSPEILKVLGGYTWKVLTIRDLQLAFYVIVGGSTIASLVLITEIYVHRRTLKKTIKK